MGLPKHIEKDLKEAEAEFKAAHPEQVSDDTSEDSTNTNDTEAPTEGAKALTSENTDAQPVQQENTDDPDGYKHRYDVLKGKYNSEVPKLQTRITELTSDMQALKEAANTDETPAKVPDSASITELRDEYGDDFVESIVNIVRDSMGDIPDRIEAVETNTASNSFERSCAELDRLKPGWRGTNDDPIFHSWLSEPDEMSGNVRQELLSNAFNNGDLQRVVRIFNAFEASQNQSQPTPITPEAQPQQRRQMPDISATGQQRDAKVYTTAEVDGFYADLTRGKYKGRENEAAAIEREIFAADREGRVVPA